MNFLDKGTPMLRVWDSVRLQWIKDLREWGYQEDCIRICAYWVSGSQQWYLDMTPATPDDVRYDLEGMSVVLDSVTAAFIGGRTLEVSEIVPTISLTEGRNQADLDGYERTVRTRIQLKNT